MHLNGPLCAPASSPFSGYGREEQSRLGGKQEGEKTSPGRAASDIGQEINAQRRARASTAELLDSS